MKTVIIIPARFQSVRFPGKPLVKLNCGMGVKKSLIQLTWEAANKVRDIDEIFVATDDRRISDAVNEFGGKTVMTSKSCKNGTERCAMVLEDIKLESDVIINFQGDAPLTPPSFVGTLIEVMKQNRNIDIATPVLRLNYSEYKRFQTDRKIGLIGGTTVTFDKNGLAMYFSKEIIPFCDEKKISKASVVPIFQHVGVYAYRPKVLKEYLTWPESELEIIEGLEQLRFLENGKVIKCAEVENKGQVFWELNNPEDVPRIEGELTG